MFNQLSESDDKIELISTKKNKLLEQWWLIQRLEWPLRKNIPHIVYVRGHIVISFSNFNLRLKIIRWNTVPKSYELLWFDFYQKDILSIGDDRPYLKVSSYWIKRKILMSMKIVGSVQKSDRFIYYCLTIVLFCY